MDSDTGFAISAAWAMSMAASYQRMKKPRAGGVLETYVDLDQGIQLDGRSFGYVGRRVGACGWHFAYPSGMAPDSGRWTPGEIREMVASLQPAEDGAADGPLVPIAEAQRALRAALRAVR